MQMDAWSVFSIVVVVVGFFGGIWYEHKQDGNIREWRMRDGYCGVYDPWAGICGAGRMLGVFCDWQQISLTVKSARYTNRFARNEQVMRTTVSACCFINESRQLHRVKREYKIKTSRAGLKKLTRLVLWIIQEEETSANIRVCEANLVNELWSERYIITPVSEFAKQIT